MDDNDASWKRKYFTLRDGIDTDLANTRAANQSLGKSNTDLRLRLNGFKRIVWRFYVRTGK